jgi:hypothetical protein
MIQVRQVVAGEHPQHDRERLAAALVVPAYRGLSGSAHA